MEIIISICAIVFLIFIMLGLAIVNYSFEDMVEKYNKFSKNITGTTPIEFANEINNIHFYEQIKIKYKDQMFSDSYNSSGILTLSSKYANDNNIASLAICAHELGHAFQFKDEKEKMKKHAKRLAFSKIMSKLTSPLFIAGIVALLFPEMYIGFILVGLSVLSFIFAVGTKVATLKIEKDASIKAMELLGTYAFLTEEDLVLARKFLNSAKQTYIADVLKSMLKWTMLVKS